MKTIKILFSIFILVAIISSCNKEGKGGSSTIEGTVVIDHTKRYAYKKDSIYTNYTAKDEKVYIIYGDNPTFDDDTRTTYNGNFKFDYLYKGEYTIYTYSECFYDIDSCTDETITILNSVTIKADNETVTLDTVHLAKYF